MAFPRPMGSRARRLLSLVGPLALLWLLPAVAAACPSCVVGAEQNENLQGFIRGQYASTAFLVTLPFLLVGSIIFSVRASLCAEPSEADPGGASSGEVGGAAGLATPPHLATP